jgi:hypothetical protein
MGLFNQFSSESKTKTISPQITATAGDGSVVAVNYGRNTFTLLPGSSYYPKAKEVNLTVSGAPPSSSGTYLANTIEGQGTSPITGLPAIPSDSKKTLIVGIIVAVVLFVVLFIVRK